MVYDNSSAPIITSLRNRFMLRQWALMNHEKNHHSKGIVLVPSVEFSLVRIV